MIPSRHPRMFLSGVQVRTRLDSRLKHAGMTDFGWAIYLTQQAAGNEPSEIQTNGASGFIFRLFTHRDAEFTEFGVFLKQELFTLRPQRLGGEVYRNLKTQT